VNLRTTALLVASALLLSGCVTLGAQYSAAGAAPPNRATVYVYRPAAMAPALSPTVAPTVSANGVPLAELPAHGYFVYYAAPGELELAEHTEAKTSVTLDVKAGETYYVKGTFGMGFFIGHPHLVLVGKDVGEKEIKDCKLVSGTVPTAERVAAGAPPATAGKK
jgi:hypothetical protein